LGEALPLIGVTAHVWCGDAINPLTTRPVDLCLLLKAIPSLDQLDRTAAERLLTTVEARHFLISFPVRSLGGREKGMIATYEARMARLLSGGSWSFHRIQVATELAFLVSPMDDEGGRLNDPK
jgi:16S rRNA (guanine(1405)-N(7))-methyltransferase